jgi:uncharacterized peroxidase-related enzyme
MPRIEAPATAEEAPVASRRLLEAAAEQLGRVPGLLRLLSVSPAALEGYLGLQSALSRGSLAAATSQRISLAVAETRGCPYCVSAQTYWARKRIGLDDAEITANRNGASNDPAEEVAVSFAVKLLRGDRRVTDDDVRALKAFGFDDAQIIEIAAHVALNIFAVLVAKAGTPAIDFPPIEIRRAA